MQYILTEAEYAGLIANQRAATKATAAELQKLCTKAAQHIPVSRDWAADPTPQPWGCILEPPSPGYCDDCPSKTVCPHPHKRWSK